MTPLTFSLLAFHAGAVYVLDSGLSEADCVPLLEPGAVTYFLGENDARIVPDATTRFACNIELPNVLPDAWQPRAIPGNGPAAEKLAGDNGPRIIQYGDDRMQPGAFADIVRATGLALKRSKHGGRTNRGRPRE